MPTNFSYYPPYGSALPGLQYNYIDDGDTSKYRFGFNTQERDDEIAGEGNSYTAEFWQYDGRLGKRFNVDPIFKEYESPYTALGNNPIWFVDVFGDDSTLYIRFNKGVSLTLKEKSSLMSNIVKSLGKAEMAKFKTYRYLNETMEENNDANLKLDYTDHLLEFELKNPNTISTIGDYASTTTYKDYWTKTTVYLDQFIINSSSNSKNYNFRLLGLVVAHEITHGFINKTLFYFNLKNTDIGLDNNGHTNGKINLLSSGTHHLSSEGVKSILKNPNCTNKPEEYNRSNILYLISWATKCKMNLNLPEKFFKDNHEWMINYLKINFNKW